MIQNIIRPLFPLFLAACATDYQNIHAYHIDCLGRTVINPEGAKVCPAATVVPSSIVGVCMCCIVIAVLHFQLYFCVTR